MRLLVPGRRFRLAPLLAAALVAGAGVWFTGCDFTRVDEGAGLPIQQHLDALATASTPDQAERAIRGVLNKVGVRTSWQADVPDEKLAFGTYSVTDDEIRALAVRHAAFVSGRTSERVRVEDVHAAVVEADRRAKAIVKNLEVGVVPFTRTPIRANATEASLVLSADAAAALRSGEEGPLGAMALAIAAEGPTLRSVLRADGPLSPVQQFLYTVWIHQNGPFIHPFLSSPASTAARLSAPDRCDTNNSPCCGDGQFTSIALLYIGAATADVEIRVTNPSNGPNSGFIPFPSAPVDPNEVVTALGENRGGSNGLAGTIGNEIGLFVNGASTPQATIHTSCSQCVLPGDVYGDFQVVGLTTKNAGLCNNVERCAGACEARYATCLENATTDEQKEACGVSFRACDFSCHDQGGID